MPNAQFLETYPLYRKWKFAVPNTLDHVPRPQINLVCDPCGDRRTFVMINSYSESRPYSNYPSEGISIVARYQCVSCREFTREFFLWIADDLSYVMKVGQFPAWSIAPDQDISKMLGQHQDYLQKAVVCESQSYGIAAFAYYRRIVEEIIGGLITDIGELIPDEHRAEYDAALEKVKTTRVTAEKIDLVKDLLPPILRPDGMNPLALLHGILSDGLHAHSDEACLSLAAEIREILWFLASQVAATKASSQSFTARMRTLLAKKVAAQKGQ